MASRRRHRRHHDFDNGPGIAADLLPHVFELFVQGTRTLDRSQGGLGIGLSVVKRLIEMHGGAVSVQNLDGDRGTCFEFRLPLIDAKDEQAEQACRAPRRHGESSSSMTTGMPLSRLRCFCRSMGN